MMQSCCQMSTMESPNLPLRALPRIRSVGFYEAELPRPAVIGFAGPSGAYSDSTTAIKELLASVLNLSGGLRSKLTIHTDYSDNEDNFEDFCCNEACRDGKNCDNDHIPLIACPQNDIRFNRSKAFWENPQTDSCSSMDPSASTPQITQALKDTILLNCSPLLECEACTQVVLTDSLIDSPLNFPLGSQNQMRRFSTPNLSNYNFNFNQTLQTSSSDIPFSLEISKTTPSNAEHAKLVHRRSQSFSITEKASDENFESRETLYNSTESLFEPAVYLENENAHFLVADMFISVVEKMKSSLQNPFRVHNKAEEFLCHHWFKQYQETNSAPCPKRRFDSTTSVDSGYDAGLAVVHQTSPRDTIVEEDVEDEEEEEMYEDVSDNSSVSTGETCLEYEDYILVGPSESERLLVAADQQSCVTGERNALTSNSNSAEQTAKKLYRAFRSGWLRLDDELVFCDSRYRDRERLAIQLAIPEEFESSLTLLNEIKKVKMMEAEDWSPPRFQIITTMHSYLRRDVIVASQNYLCAGCGTQLEPKYTSKLRYCDYFGKYFCDCCHSSAVSFIPSRILLKWNFSKYYVSDFAESLVESIYNSHVFNIELENPMLYKTVRELKRVHELQEQLICIKKLLSTCRHARRTRKTFKDLPSYLTDDLHLFTLYDLYRVKYKVLLPALREMMTTCVAHVENCELCQAKGFICEFCQNPDVIFPYQTEICKKCEACKACYHKKCFKTNDCPKCRRLEARKLKLERPLSDDSDDDEDDDDEPVQPNV